MFSQRKRGMAHLGAMLLASLGFGGARSATHDEPERKPVMAPVRINGFQKAPWRGGSNTRLPADRQVEIITAARAKRDRKNKRRRAEHDWAQINNDCLKVG